MTIIEDNINYWTEFHQINIDLDDAEAIYDSAPVTLDRAGRFRSCGIIGRGHGGNIPGAAAIGQIILRDAAAGALEFNEYIEGVVLRVIKQTGGGAAFTPNYFVMVCLRI